MGGETGRSEAGNHSAVVGFDDPLQEQLVDGANLTQMLPVLQEDQPLLARAQQSDKQPSSELHSYAVK